MMKMKKLAGIATVALATLAAPFVSNGAGTGDIFEIRPVNESGASIPALTEPLSAGSTLRFVVRLAAPTIGSPAQPGNPFRLVHIPGLNTEATDWALNRPAMGIYVNGKLTLAYLDDERGYPYLKAAQFTDFVFTYTVKSGDFALPVRLANSDGSMVTQDSSDVKYFVSFGNGYMPAWKVDDSTAEGGAATREAVFQYGNPGYPFSQPEMDRWSDNYDLTQCNFNIRTIAFDEPTDPFTPGYWRTVPQGEAGYKDLDAPRLVLTGSFPTNSVKLYLWSEDESAVYLAAGKERDVHVTADKTEKRHVLEIDSVADYVKDINGYEFQIAGADAGKGKAANVVLSAFPDFNYTTGALTPERIGDYLYVPVLCGEPSSAKVTIKPGRNVITAKHDYLVYETELSVSFNKPYGEDVWVEIVPSFNDEAWAAEAKWWDYIRLSGQGDTDPTLETPTANPKVLIPAGSKYPTQFEDGSTIDSGKIYLYALRTDEYVTGAKKMTFAVKTDNEHALRPVAEGGIEGWSTDLVKKPQSALTINGEPPVVVEMFDGAEHATTAVDSKRTLKIKVSDVYADMVSETGYEIWYVLNVDSATETTFKKLDGLWKPGAGNILYRVGTKDELPTVVYKEDGEISSLVKIKAPVSGTESAEHAFTMTVTIPKGYVVETSDGQTEFDEGASLQLKVTLDEQNKFGDMYAYLKPRDTLSETAVDCAWLAKDGKPGIPMKQYDQVLATGLKLQIIDGDGTALGSTLTYEVVFCSTPAWDPEKTVSAYRAKNILTLTTHNVIPSIGLEKGTYVQMNGNSQQRVSENGGTIAAKFPMDFTQKFAAKVYEPGTADKTAEAPNQFQTRWLFTDEDGTTYGPNEAPMEGANPGILFGNPDTTGCTFDFPAAGRWTVTVELKDKDMEDFGNGEIGEMFTFHVDVVDQPTITVETEGSYAETSSVDNGGEAEIALVLALNSYNGPLTVNLKIEPNEAGSTAPGVFTLVESAGCVLQADGSYNVTVPKKTTRVPLAIKTLDGTRDSRLTGFRITPKMISEDIIPNSGNKKACDYYVGVEETPVKVTNVEPQLDPELDVYPVPGTNVFKTALGKVDEAITWSFSDVTPDFERPASGSLNGGPGVKVEFKGGGGWGPKWYTSLKEAMEDGAKGFYPNFKQSGAGQTVKLIITDPDNGIVTVMWTYDVAPSKSMQAVAHGPASGNGGTRGKSYRSAGGIGEGRIWADAKSSISASSFESTINCGIEKTYKIYGYGYKVGDVDDGATLHYPDGTLGYYLDRDTPLNEDGANLLAGETAYAYPDAVRDSFLYTWLQITRGEGDGESSSALSDEVMGGAAAPEYWKVKDSGSTVGLPAKQDSSGTGAAEQLEGYDITTIEAIFAKEFLPSDNMGDINADGIPDVYVDKYKFDVVDETGVLSGDDLRDLNFASGEDPEPYCVDYLPAFKSSAYSALIPGLADTWVDTGRPFIPRLKIRGFDEEDSLAKKNREDDINSVGASALNDAPALVKIQNVLCDRVYTNPREDKKSTLNYVEWLAWSEFKAAYEAANPGATATESMWSPERPSDPTKPDTDGDGMTDGYEYYFWYLAHVGWVDEAGNHRYLTGRKYDPRNPGEGRLITSEEIEKIFDPISPSAFSNLTDTDNDGLPDILEFEIGTNPIDFDTDGDGLPDGWELTIAGLDPTTANSSADAIGDTKRNYDGDAMAIGSYKLDELVMPKPTNSEHAKRWTFAIEAEDGDTDGVQWYAMMVDPELEVDETVETWWQVTVGGITYCATNEPVIVEGRLAAGLTVFTKSDWAPKAEEEEESETELTEEPGGEEPPAPPADVTRGYPVKLAAGSQVVVAPGEGKLVSYKIKTAVEAKDANACWIYGKYGVDMSALDVGLKSALRGEVADTAADYGCLALARQLAVPAGAKVFALPSDERDVAFLHFLCYQEFGFDPRTAWSATDPLHTRWVKTIDGEGMSGTFTAKRGGYTGIPTRTRAYTAYDEFLVYSFFYNNEGTEPGFDRPDIGDDALDLVRAWYQLTTNPQGPNEPELVNAENYKGRASDNGADTDMDGVPDGWELYIMAGPKADGAYVFAPPYRGFKTAMGNVAPESYWSPFVGKAASAETASTLYTPCDGVRDDLNELREFSGTDSSGHYADPKMAGGTVPYSTTILLRSQQTKGAGDLYTADDSKWLNKFFPTDPWAGDTDGDGLSDSAEGTSDGPGVCFIYGAPVDNGGRSCFPGGGLNPLSVDTDTDGLPDGWEYQFKASHDSIYDGEDADYAEDADGNPCGNPLQGLTDGMDGTVMDARNYPDNGVVNETGIKPCVNRDYDRDGLDNWQEYLTGIMRCWRYDDPVSPIDYFPSSLYFTTGEDGNTKFDAEQAAKNLNEAGLLETDDIGEFWYKTLLDPSSPAYNPHLVTDTSSGAQYLSRVTNGWDAAYIDKTLDSKHPAGAYYWFYHRIEGTSTLNAWAPQWVKAGLDVKAILAGTYALTPKKYACCSPIDPDSDHDGMDDFYELFHGLNPLLGQSGVSGNWMLVGSRGAVVHDTEGFDVVYDSLYQGGKASPQAFGKGDTEESFKNYWQRVVEAEDYAGKKPRGTGFDFEVFPWLAGLASADPDGDGTVNQEESIMGLTAPQSAWHHSDPTPLWMTDSSYTNSLTRMFYRMPTRMTEIAPDGDNFTYDEKVFNFADIGGVVDKSFVMFVPETWGLCSANSMNYIASFEENEGFDSDHDGLSDSDEVSGKFRGQSDANDADSPRRRQAMYFQGKDRPSILQTMPTVKEQHPVDGYKYPDDMSFLHYTVECWVKAETLDDATVIERASWVGESNPGDQEFLRCNFQLGVKEGKWFTKYDPNDTTRKTVAVLSDIPATTDWTHLAATYDGTTLVLYVNGQSHGAQTSGLQPAYGSSAAWLHYTADLYNWGRVQNYWCDGEYQLNAIVIGASFKTCADGITDGNALDVTKAKGWDAYKSFFKGYVDEIRVWDGARTANEIGGSMQARFSREDVLANRSAYYEEWAKGGPNDEYRGRYAKDENGNAYQLPAELRYHWAFDSVFGAVDEARVAKAPNGFDFAGNATDKERALLSRPEGYEIAWWKTVLDSYTETVYSHPAWIEWVPNTVAHLPRFDGTTLDSFYWSEDFQGDKLGTYKFARTAEPVSRWTQYAFDDAMYLSTASRHYLADATDKKSGSSFVKLYDFTGRHLNQSGDDLLPLGGAFVKQTTDMWDGQGASSNWEIGSGNGDSADGIPAWWAAYANDMYYDGSDEITWDSVVTWPEGGTITMKAGEAYMRDLARGYVSNKAGDYAIVNGSEGDFTQTYDMDGNGLPDWWEQLYGLTGVDSLADSDNDGLPNYVEYLLSEVFDFEVFFSPINPRSVDPYTLDYFYKSDKLGGFYAGEIYTDHDLVDDAWEDVYGKDFASRLVWDAYADADYDGWSNRSENRYSNQVMPIQADKQTHYSSADGLVADYPIPTIELTLNYNESMSDTVRSAPIIVQMTRNPLETAGPDATWEIGRVAESTAGTGTESTESTDKTIASYTRTLGKWSNRHAIGTLSPGYINKDSVMLQYCFDPDALIYSWEVHNMGSGLLLDEDGEPVYNGYGRIYSSEIWYIKRGTRVEYDEDRRKFGEGNVRLLSRESGYSNLSEDQVVLRTAEGSSLATWVLTKSNLEFGTLDLTTGAFDINFGAFVGQYVANVSNASEYVSMEDQTYRITYTVNPSVDLPRKLYLGQATTGYVKEGKNQITAFADLNGDGVYTPGEPYGIANDVDVSWKGTKAKIELCEFSPVTPRINLWGASGGSSSSGGSSGGKQGTARVADRVRTVSEIYQEIIDKINAETMTESQRSNALARTRWMDTNVIAEPVISQTEDIHVRVVRWLVDGSPVWRCGVTPRVILDKKFRYRGGAALTEADILSDGAFDLDWKYLQSEVVNASGVRLMELPVAEVDYLVVIGDGVTAWKGENDTNNVIRALQQVVCRKYGTSRVKPTVVSPSKAGGQTVRDANPTFRWKVDEESVKGYTAFKVQVSDEANDLVYDSGILPAPAREADGCYSWKAPLFVGDKLPNGTVYENDKNYKWKVSMYNSKYTTDSFSAEAVYKQATQTNGFEYGTANVLVKYFGPKETYAKATIRVRAYESPDFTGEPVGAGYVAMPDDSVTGVAVTGIPLTNVNCRVVGLPKGTYYLQAFIDSNNNGVCDKFESMGYLCDRSGNTANWLDPVAIRFDNKVGVGDIAVIYVEDADTDGDSLPDGWEYATQDGDLTKLGATGADIVTIGEFVTDKNVAKVLNEHVKKGYAGGIAGEILTTLGSSKQFMALASGVDPKTLEPDVKVAITDLSFDVEKNEVAITFSGDVISMGEEINNALYTYKPGDSLKFQVIHADEIGGTWQPVGDVKSLKVTVGDVGDTLRVGMEDLNVKGGFFRVVVIVP